MTCQQAISGSDQFPTIRGRNKAGMDLKRGRPHSGRTEANHSLSGTDQAMLIVQVTLLARPLSSTDSTAFDVLSPFPERILVQCLQNPKPCSGLSHLTYYRKLNICHFQLNPISQLGFPQAHSAHGPFPGLGQITCYMICFTLQTGLCRGLQPTVLGSVVVR